MKRILLIMSSGIFLTLAMLVVLLTLVLARTAHVQTQDPSVDCSVFTTFPWSANDPTNCRAYWYCEASDSEAVPRECASGYYFEDGEQACLLDTDDACENTQPEPVDPEPVDPEPVDPEPVDPEPVDPEPVDPEPVDPEPVDPEPVDPEPVDPEPVDPEPVDPEPVDRNQLTRNQLTRNQLTRNQ
ncbi:hypothetical protein HA402_008025 [Bradysia odoriphaga]|nr:hypothetical protein HA402_008025 [Bradysia odoriphaga]